MSDFLVIKVSKAAIEGNNDEMLLSEVKDFLSKQPNCDYYRLRKTLSSYLTSNNKKQTPERFKILEKVCEQNQIFSIKAIHQIVSQDIHISIKTVSSTFSLLQEAGLIKPVFQIREKFKPSYFEMAS